MRRCIQLGTLAVILGSGLFSSLARGWDCGAHEIIAAIAYGRLNPKARDAVTRLAAQLPTAGTAYDRITMACWMDDLRTRGTGMAFEGKFLSWHYIDIGLASGDPEPSFEPGTDNDAHGNVVQGLKRAIVVLKGGTDPYIPNQAVACAIVMHLVGDIHQPLHASSEYYLWKGWHDNDKGGNREAVENGPVDRTKFNLHNFWDSSWRTSMDDQGRVALDLRFDEGRGDHHEPDLILPMAQEIEKAFPAPEHDLAAHIDQWARESNQIARDVVYPGIAMTEDHKSCRLSSGYIAKANALSRQRLVLAACRLAALLNETLGSASPVPIPPPYPAGPASVPGGW